MSLMREVELPLLAVGDAASHEYAAQLIPNRLPACAHLTYRHRPVSISCLRQASALG